MFVPLHVDYEQSPATPLFDPASLEGWKARLEADLLADRDYPAGRDNEAVRRALDIGGWFQRVDIPGTKLTTTSDHSQVMINTGNPLQTLSGTLTDQQGSILRPRAKWCYLEPMLPDLTGKTVLDAGCNCGFFSFEFARLGATRVTGCDLVTGSLTQAGHIAREKQCLDRVKFVHDDFTRSSELKSHDVVFMSEVFTHSPSPVNTLYAAALLADETLIIDDFFERQDGPLDFFIVVSPEDKPFLNTKPGQFIFLAASVSERLMLKSLRIAGVLPSKVRRLQNPMEPRHTLIIADMRGARERRENELWHPYLRSMIGAERQSLRAGL
jgi:SAM-dependent methyltransferase